MLSYKSILAFVFLLPKVSQSLEWIPISSAQAFQVYRHLQVMKPPAAPRIAYAPYVVRASELPFGVDFSKPKTQTFYKATLIPSDSPVYEFKYKIHDPKEENYQEKEETRVGDSVRGYYKVREPNGYVRLVKYVSDENGFQTQVSHHHAGNNGEEGYLLSSRRRVT